MNKRAAFVLLYVTLVTATIACRFWIERAQSDGALVLQGNVEVRQVNLGFKVAGRIAELDVDEGDRVEAGAKLAMLDKVYFEDNLNQLRAQRDQSAANLAKLESGNRPQEIAQAEAQVADREAGLANMKRASDRAAQLLKSGSGTQKAVDDTTMAVKQAEAQLASSQQALHLMKAGFREEDINLARAQRAEREAALRIAERQLTDADLIAPGPGVVLSRVRERGAIVNAGESVFVLSLVDPVWVRTYVSELDLARVKPGADVELRLDAPNAKPLHGRVGFVSTTAEFTPKTVETRELRTALVYRIRILARDPDNVLRQGMPLTAILETPAPVDGSKK